MVMDCSQAYEDAPACVFSYFAVFGLIVLTITSPKQQQIIDISRKIRKSPRAAGRLHLNQAEKQKAVFRLVRGGLQWMDQRFINTVQLRSAVASRFF
jgi:hypothetical protein